MCIQLVNSLWLNMFAECNTIEELLGSYDCKIHHHRHGASVNKHSVTDYTVHNKSLLPYQVHMIRGTY